MPATLTAEEARAMMDHTRPEAIDKLVVRRCLSKSPTSLVRVSLLSLDPGERPDRENAIRDYFEPEGYAVRRIIDGDIGIDAVEVDWSDQQ